MPPNPPWGNVTPFYATGSAGFASAVTFGETTFPGILDTADAEAYSVALHTSHTLRYATGPLLAPGDVVTIDGVNYKIAAVPRSINAAEMQAQLVRQP